MVIRLALKLGLVFFIIEGIKECAQKNVGLREKREVSYANSAYNTIGLRSVSRAHVNSCSLKLIEPIF
jgi:hypothetical protein